MSWQTEMTEILRVLLNDIGDTPAYTDSNLQRVLLVSAKQVGREATFSNPYVVDINAMSITPDPTDDAGNTRDDGYVNLACLKAACILDRGEAALAAKKAIAVSDSGSSVDLRGVATARLALLKQGWCNVYTQEKLQYLAGQSRVAAAAVMTPFRIYAGSGGYLVSGDRNRNILY